MELFKLAAVLYTKVIPLFLVHWWCCCVHVYRYSATTSSLDPFAVMYRLLHESLQGCYPLLKRAYTLAAPSCAVVSPSWSAHPGHYPEDTSVNNKLKLHRGRGRKVYDFTHYQNKLYIVVNFKNNALTWNKSFLLALLVNVLNRCKQDPSVL